MPVMMELSRIFIREMSGIQFIELQEVDGDRSFPIGIGLPEAMAIERRLKGIEPPRPQTHDLLASTIESLGARLDRIIIHDLRDSTYFAKLVAIQDGREIEIDSRPSDAIALSVQYTPPLPIYVSEEVLDEVLSE